MISHTTAQFRKMFAELPAEVNVKPVEHIKSSRRIRINRVFVSSRFILRGRFIRFGSVLAIEQWESWKAMKSCGIGLARTLTMTNFFHSRDADPNHWVEKGAENRASHPPC